MFVYIDGANGIEQMKELENFNGFVTIATGKEKYHKLAYTLMKSYKLKAINHYRFAVITDKITKYEEEFDDVIVINDATRSYLDKIALLINCPYKKNIFIDSDCIAYRDLNIYWDVFAESGDFSAFGRVLSCNAEDGWYSIKNLGQYSQKVNYILDIHGGIYYIKKGNSCEKMYSLCLELIKQYDSFEFRRFKKPADEPILALAMAINDMKPVKPEVEDYVWLRRAKKVKADFFKNSLRYDFDNQHTNQGRLLHFGSSHTIAPLYLIESSKVRFSTRYNRSWNTFERIITYIVEYIKGTFYCVLYLKNKIRKLWDI